MTRMPSFPSWVHTSFTSASGISLCNRCNCPKNRISGLSFINAISLLVSVSNAFFVRMLRVSHRFPSPQSNTSNRGRIGMVRSEKNDPLVGCAWVFGFPKTASSAHPECRTRPCGSVTVPLLMVCASFSFIAILWFPLWS